MNQVSFQPRMPREKGSTCEQKKILIYLSNNKTREGKWEGWQMGPALK